MLAVGRSAYKHWVVRTKNLDATALRRLQYFSFLRNEASACDSDDLVQLVFTGNSISLVKDLFHENPQTVNRKGVCSFRLPGFLILARCSLFVAAMLFFKSNCIYRLKNRDSCHASVRLATSRLREYWRREGNSRNERIRAA